MLKENELIAMTNRFYLDISKNFISDKEYLVLHRILIEQCSFEQIGNEFDIDGLKLKDLFLRILVKVQTVSDLITQVHTNNSGNARMRKRRIVHFIEFAKQQMISQESDFDRKIKDSSFPFNRRLSLLLEKRNIKTFKELLAIPIHHFPLYAGFGFKTIQELIRFIEYEKLDDFYVDFERFSKNYKIIKNQL